MCTGNIKFFGGDCYSKFIAAIFIGSLIEKRIYKIAPTKMGTLF
jgi:hypothetical protein